MTVDFPGNRSEGDSVSAPSGDLAFNRGAGIRTRHKETTIMKSSYLFDAVMALLWGNVADEKMADRTARAVAAYVKNHRINIENACEVLAIMWPEAAMVPRLEAVTQNEDQSEVWFDVTFKDGGQILLMTRRGIGSAVEVIS